MQTKLPYRLGWVIDGSFGYPLRGGSWNSKGQDRAEWPLTHARMSRVLVLRFEL